MALKTIVNFGVGSAIAISALSLVSTPVGAVQITTSIGTFEITTITPDDPDFLNTIGMQPWFTGDIDPATNDQGADGSLAKEFAEQLGEDLGFPNLPYGPFFAYATRPSFGGTFLAWGFLQDFGLFNSASPYINPTGPDEAISVFAVATPVEVVPEPLTILGAGSAIAFGTAFKRKLSKKKG